MKLPYGMSNAKKNRLLADIQNAAAFYAWIGRERRLDGEEPRAIVAMQNLTRILYRDIRRTMGIEP